MDENAVGTCAELIFAPIDPSFADDAPLLPSGFRIICLDSKKVCAITVFPSLLFFCCIHLCSKISKLYLFHRHFQFSIRILNYAGIVQS